MGKFNSHTIVYLDQNYLSNMAKARTGSIKDKDLAKFWHSLFNDLKKAVLADKIACPTSEFHITETTYDTRHEESIRGIIDELSWGLEFHPWRNILEVQIEDAARVFLGKRIEKREYWVTAFQSNPQAPVDSRMQDIAGSLARINVHFTFPQEIVEQDRSIKEAFVPKVQEVIRDSNNNPSTWLKLILENKKGMVDGLMGRLAIDNIRRGLRSNLIWDRLSAQDNYMRLNYLFNQLIRIGIKSDMMAKFRESKELLDSPFIDISSSICAAIADYHRLQGRNIRSSDFDDVAILAMALPFCDIIATDSFMKEIIVKRLHFDDKYKTKLFSAIKLDRLSFQNFINRLLNSTL